MSVHLSMSPGLFQNAQENHGLAVPTPSVPEDFADKEVGGKRTLILWLLRLLFLPAWALDLKQNKQANIPVSPAGGKASVLRPLGDWSRWVTIMGLVEPSLANTHF